MKTVIYNSTYVSVPDDEPEENYSRGLIIGPPDISRLGLPEEIEARLHHELFVRQVITRKDALKKRNEIYAALQAAFSLDVDRILECYDG